MGNLLAPPPPVKVTEAMIAKQKRQEAIERQAVLELAETKITLHFVFGDEVPKKRKDILKIPDVTSRQLWMEDFFLFNEIKKHYPNETFHPAKDYVLKWQPLGVSFKLLVPLDNPQIQDEVLKQLAFIPPGSRDLILFHFTPKNPTMNMFAPYVHPSSLESFRTRVQVLNKLCAFYLEGRMNIDDLEATLSSHYSVWRIALFNLLRDDEQVFHQYLKEQLEVEVKVEALEKDYIAGNISLQTYADFKFPERKRLRDIMALKYPQPYTYSNCIICTGDKGVIHCELCSNMVCVACIETQFLNESTKEGSFLLMHRRYCLRLGKILTALPQLSQEPAYLRILKNTGRAAALERLLPKPVAIVEEKQDDEDSVDEEELYQQELARRKAQEEEERRRRECPPELEEVIESLKKVQKKIDKIKKEILDLQGRLDEGGHSDNYNERVTRLKNEEIEKMNSQVLKQLTDFSNVVKGLNLSSNSVDIANEKIEILRGKAQRLVDIKDVKSYQKAERLAEEALSGPPPVDVDALLSVKVRAESESISMKGSSGKSEQPAIAEAGDSSKSEN